VARRREDREAEGYEEEVTQTRDELERWVAQTKRNQRRIAVGLVAGLGVAIALAATLGAAGGFAIVIVVLVGICAFWITGAHLLDFRRKLKELDQPADAKRGKFSDL